MKQFDNKVLIILTNYSRPENMPKIIESWKNQSIQDNKIIVADNRELNTTHTESKINKREYGVDDVWHWTENSGCPCHFYPALSQTRYKYCIFADDDLIPGRYAVEVLLNHAHTLKDKFTTIGQIGRNFLLGQPSGKRYSGRNTSARHPTQPVKTDITCRAHMVQTEYLPYVLFFRNGLCQLNDPDAERLAHIHDDFLLCIGIQLETGFPSYLISDTRNKENELIKEDLDNDNKGVWRKPGHWIDRNKMVDLSLELGWKHIQ